MSNSHALERLTELNLPSGFTRRVIDRLPSSDLGRAICQAASDYAESDDPIRDGTTHFILGQRDSVGTILGLGLDNIVDALATTDSEIHQARSYVNSFMSD